MQILERGQENKRLLLFFPCTAEPVWAFEGAMRLLSQKYQTVAAAASEVIRIEALLRLPKGTAFYERPAR